MQLSLVTTGVVTGDGCFRYYADENAKKLKGVIDVRGKPQPARSTLLLPLRHQLFGGVLTLCMLRYDPQARAKRSATTIQQRIGLPVTRKQAVLVGQVNIAHRTQAVVKKQN